MVCTERTDVSVIVGAAAAAGRRLPERVWRLLSGVGSLFGRPTALRLRLRCGVDMLFFLSVCVLMCSWWTITAKLVV
jgi:hypothetical protein